MKHLPRIIIDAVLFCPHCGARHVDESRNGEKWHRRAHTTHRCQACGGDFDVYVSGQASDEKPVVPPAPKVGDRVRVVGGAPHLGWIGQTGTITMKARPDHASPWNVRIDGCPPHASHLGYHPIVAFGTAELEVIAP